MESKRVLGYFIPVYNTPKKYIKQTLDSVVAANEITEDKIEAVVVDNGSESTVLPWLKHNYGKYDFIKIVRINVNKGKPQSTMKAIPMLNTQYVQNLDSDDWVNLDNIEEFVNQLETSTSDMIITGYTYFDDRNGKTKNRMVSKNWKTRTYNSSKPMPRIQWHFDTNTIIRKDLLMANEFKIPSYITAYEDVYINLWAMQYAREVKIIEASSVFYRTNTGSNLSSTEVLIKKKDEFENMVKGLTFLEYDNPATMNHMAYHYANQMYAVHFFDYIGTGKMSNRESYVRLNNYLKENNHWLYRKVHSWNPKKITTWKGTFGGYNLALKMVTIWFKRYR